MNFNDSSTDRKVGSKPVERKSNQSGQKPGSSNVDRAAMDSAQKAQDRIHKNENTNSGNTVFSK